MIATLASTKDELLQIVQLSQVNSKANITEQEKNEQGFISWPYTIDLIEKMHQLHPSVIVKDGDKVVGYALVALKAARQFHAEMEEMVSMVDKVPYNGKPLGDYNYYIMGQVCVDKAYRGKGVFNRLYQKHKEVFQHQFDFIETEISVTNLRSIRAHEKVGFKTIYTYPFNNDEWNVVIWEWQ